jgi:hypothetical protein
MFEINNQWITFLASEEDHENFETEDEYQTTLR